MFYDKFEALSHDRHMTPSSVCKELGFATSAASYWKTSGKTPKRESILKIARFFNVKPEYLTDQPDEDPTFFSRLYELCVRNGTTPSGICRELGLSKSTATHWKQGYFPRYTVMVKIAERFNVPLSYFYDGKSDASVPVDDDDVCMIPVYDSISAGFSEYANNHIVDTIPVIKKSSEFASTICIRVSGDSMSPLICDGDIIQVCKTESAEPGDVVVVLIDGEDALVKQINFSEHRIELISINTNYRTRVFERSDMQRVRILGKVRRVIRDL